MPSTPESSPRAQLLAYIAAIHAQTRVIESTSDQQEFEEALSDIESAVAELRTIK